MSANYPLPGGEGFDDGESEESMAIFRRGHSRWLDGIKLVNSGKSVTEVRYIGPRMGKMAAGIFFGSIGAGVLFLLSYQSVTANVNGHIDAFARKQQVRVEQMYQQADTATNAANAALDAAIIATKRNEQFEKEIADLKSSLGKK